MLIFGIKSLWNRRFVAVLTILSISLSVTLILGVERVRYQAKVGFSNSASGVDLIVAARGNSVQILLSTVFGVGSTESSLSWDTFEKVENLTQVSWAVPITMGDNHRGFPVIGTNANYFKRFRHSGGKSLEFASGSVFTSGHQAVIGSELASRFGYTPGADIILAHGSGSVAFDLHDETPFQIAGVLTQTRTAIDRMIFVPLEGFDDMHEQSKSFEADPLTDSQDFYLQHADHESRPDIINAIYVGLKNRTDVLSIQRNLTEYKKEPLTAVMPQVALLKLWSITGTAETALGLMAVTVVLTGIIGMVVMLSAVLEARRREFGILRSVGASPAYIFGLIMLEAVMLTISGLVLGYLLLTGVVLLADPILTDKFGLRLGYGLSSTNEVLLMLAILVCGMLASLVPAIRVYRMTVADGLTLRM